MQNGGASQGNLSDRVHWDLVHDRVHAEPARGVGGRLAHRLFGAAFFERYFERLFWDGAFRQFVDKPAGSTLLEIGSAPGLNLIRLCRKFQFQPWGIEYSPVGATANRATFGREGYPETNLIEGDIFDEQLIQAHENRFDIVYSAGLIEHFENPRDLIARHVRLAAPGGFIVITVPNLHGVNAFLLKVLNPALLDIHNLELMKLDNFRQAFADCGAEMKYSGLLGFFDSDIVFAPVTPMGRLIAPLLMRFNLLVNAAAHMALRGRKCESQSTSPFVVAILRKPAR